MTELHCHILPGIDDGARNTSEALALLRAEAEQGVDRIVFTPHFNESISVDEFVWRRADSFERLKTALADTNLEFDMKLGAEVYFTPALRDMNLAPLCFSGTGYMLVELPTTHKPAFLNETLSFIESLGITPIIAHVERYPYAMDDLTLIYEWVDGGALVQTNAGALWHNDSATRTILKLIEWDLVHLVSTDAHSPDKRPVNFYWGLDVLEKTLGRDVKRTILENGDDVFDNIELEPSPYCPKKSFGRWK